MGRSRTYQDATVARAARDVFWAEGYADTGIGELEAATGLNRSSLYHGFGSKRGLFDAAVASYLDEVVRPALGALREGVVPASALDSYLRRLAEEIGAPGGALSGRGCLLLNAATDGIDERVGEIVRAYRAELASAVAAGVAAARPELSADAAATLATTCTAHVVAAMALARVDPDEAVAFLVNARRLLAASS